ncbi:T6SS phospholipase effector Tle1-like catalytic domain-containing protein [Photorhabdus tasmaniensis]|uniref:T6SS phospholipase effector Tle1-like catalytic domain-containing protein n=1 Tax=Photorhabdus tasmaniensis TaxID=1004159 RepID=UPI0040435C8E
MSKINHNETVWLPAPFPAQGRLPAKSYLVGQNCHRQTSDERAYHQELCLAADRRVLPPCCKTLHVSLFFDGTGNNLYNDLYQAVPNHPTNIARLFQTTIGAGYAGGAAGKPLLDDVESTGGKYFKYYIPGVGTPFPEINDLDYTLLGLAGADRGEDRINWALLRLIDVLGFSLTQKQMTNSESQKSLEAMSTTWHTLGLGGSHNRYGEFYKQFSRLKRELVIARRQPGRSKSKLLGMKLYVYGFSRGAAEARAFVNWLAELLPSPSGDNPKPSQCLQAKNETDPECNLPISVEFLGLFDTVASVGVSHVVPVVEGHMAWADGTQELPSEETYGGLVKRCVHLVSTHEQRLSFPLDSIRRSDGTYPTGSTEVIYPGVHSDLGGGYPPGEQGKSIGKTDGLLLSQIALHEMYAAAFQSGAPLKVPQAVLPADLQNKLWRAMHADIQQEFTIAPELINRFNAWRQVTLGLEMPKQPLLEEEAARFEPVRSTVALEQAMKNQMDWLTAWRINRYAGGTLLSAPFFHEAPNRDANKAHYEQSQQAQEEKQQAVLKQRKAQWTAFAVSGKRGEPPVLAPGVPDFDPEIAQKQLREAAAEFSSDYRGERRELHSAWQFALDDIMGTAIYALNSDDDLMEYLQMKLAGEALVKRLFEPVPMGKAGQPESPASLLVALYDNQVHDSRAWFMYSSIGSREPWGGYFRYRVIYFGKICSRQLSLLTVAGNVVGAVSPAGNVLFDFKQKKVVNTMVDTLGKVSKVPATQLEMSARDLSTRELIPMLPDAEQTKAFTHNVGEVTSQQRRFIEERRLQIGKENLKARWAGKRLKPTPKGGPEK